MRKVFTDYMRVIGAEDPKLAVLVGDISHFALQGFAKECPGRFYNIGILEPTIVSMSAGLAASGLYPVAHTITPFLIERSLEQIKLDFCYQGLGGTLISVGSAFDYSGLGCSHHSYSDLALLKGIPNTEVVYPASDIEFTKLFKDTYQNNRLTYFRLPTAKHHVEFSADQIAMGRGIKVKEGTHLTLITDGPHLDTVMATLPELEKNNVRAEVLYFPCLKPLDQDLIRKSVSETRHVLVIEEHALTGGLYQDVLTAAQGVGEFQSASIHIPDAFQRGYGQYQDHLNQLGFTSANVTAQSLKLVSKKG